MATVRPPANALVTPITSKMTGAVVFQSAFLIVCTAIARLHLPARASQATDTALLTSVNLIAKRVALMATALSLMFVNARRAIF